MSRERGKAATLMLGAVDRSDIYKSVELSLDQLISEHLYHVLAAGREIRKAEIGEEAAAEEERRGNISDAEYAKDAAARREARERQRKQDETRKRREEEKEKLRAEASKKEAELERLRKADERRRERKAREDKLEEDRRKRIEEEEERRKYYEQRKNEEAEGELSSHRPAESSFAQRSVERVAATGKASSLSPHPIKKEDTKTPTSTVPEIDEKAIEAAALEELLRESRELAAKSSSKPQVERSDSRDSPYRRSLALKPRSSNISPSKSADPRHPIRSEPIKPKLSFSATNLSRGATTQREPPPLLRNRSKSPASDYRHSSSYRSRSHSRTHRDASFSHNWGPENNSHKPTTPHRDPDPKSYKNDVRDASRHSHSLARDDTREEGSHKVYHRESTHDREGSRKHHQHNYDKEEQQSPACARSPSRRDEERDHSRERERHKDRNRDYDRGHERDHDRFCERHRRSKRWHGGEKRYRCLDCSRSPHRDMNYKYHYEESKSAKSEVRTKSPVDIDRYVPTGGPHTKETERVTPKRRDLDTNPKDESHKHRIRESVASDEIHRSRGQEQGPRAERHMDREADLPDERHKRRELDLQDDNKHRDRERDRDQDRERERKRERYHRDDAQYEERHDDRDRYRDRDRDRDRRDRRERDRDQDWDKERDHEKDRGRDRRHDHRRDDYDRGKERRDDGHDRDRDRDRGRGYVEIDRYIPSGRDDAPRTRRDRSR